MRSSDYSTQYQRLGSENLLITIFCFKVCLKLSVDLFEEQKCKPFRVGLVRQG
jgi:hypothetical protein